MTRVAASWLLAAAWLAWAGQVRAETGRAQLTLERPAQSFCPTREAIERDVEALAGHPVFTDDARAATRVRCDISEHASGVAARIEVRDESGTLVGTRDLAAGAGECASLREPISVVLLMLLDREATPGETIDDTGGPPARSVGLGASFGGFVGLLPRTTSGLGLVLVPRLTERLHARLDAGYWLPVTAQTSEGTGASFRAFSLSGALCAGLPRSPRGIGVALCAGVQLAVLQASARNLLTEHREARAFGQGFLALELAGRFGRSELKADFGPVLSVGRPRFYLLQADGTELEVHEPRLVGAFFRLALIIWAP